jgi:hypothetical protein
VKAQRILCNLDNGVGGRCAPLPRNVDWRKGRIPIVGLSAVSPGRDVREVAHLQVLPSRIVYVERAALIWLAHPGRYEGCDSRRRHDSSMGQPGRRSKQPLFLIAS